MSPDHVQEVSLGAILSVIGERLLCDIGEVYQILNFLTGESLYTHQLPRARDAAAPILAQRFPELAAIDTSDVTPANWRAWLREQRRIHGNTRQLTPLPVGTYQAHDPIAELVTMRGGDASNIIVVKP